MKDINLKKFLKVHLIVVAIIIVYVLLPIKCPIKYFFYFDCPTCGMTRAMLSLFRGDISAYLSFNPLALPFLLVLLFGVHKDFISISNKIKTVIIVSGAVLVAFAYILKIFFI